MDKAFVDDPLQFGGRLAGNALSLERDWRGGLGENRALGVGCRRSSEGKLAAQHLVEDNAQGEDVRAMVHLNAPRLLGGHVGDGAHDLAGIGFSSKCCFYVTVTAPERLHQLGEAEVDDLGVAVLSHHDVGGFEVSMNDALGVGSGETLGDFGGEIERTGKRQSILREDVTELLSLDELHRYEGDAVDFIDLENDCDVGMVKSCGRLRFLHETAPSFGVRHELGWENLDSYFTIQLGVERTVDDAHTATADFRQDFVVRNRSPDHVLMRASFSVGAAFSRVRRL